MFYFPIALAIWNFVTLIVFGVDKLKAVNGGWRIRESVLLILSALFGAAGGTLGMLIFRHKTKKPKFILVYIMFVLQVAAAVLICVYAF